MGRWKYFWTQLQGSCGLALFLCMHFLYEAIWNGRRGKKMYLGKSGFRSYLHHPVTLQGMLQVPKTHSTAQNA